MFNNRYKDKNNQFHAIAHIFIGFAVAILLGNPLLSLLTAILIELSQVQGDRDLWNEDRTLDTMEYCIGAIIAMGGVGLVKIFPLLLKLRFDFMIF